MRFLLALIFAVVAWGQTAYWSPDVIYQGQNTNFYWSCPSTHTVVGEGSVPFYRAVALGIGNPIGTSSGAYFNLSPSATQDGTVDCVYDTIGEFPSDEEPFHPHTFSTTATVTVYPCHLPSVWSFSANPTNILRGQSSLLSFSCNTDCFSNATINPGSYNFVLDYGSQTVSPISTTMYTVTCYDEYGSFATAQASVTVTSSGAKLIVIIGGH